MRRLILCAVVVLCGFGQVEAALIVRDRVSGSNDGLITLDTDTNLEWLDVTESVDAPLLICWGSIQLSTILLTLWATFSDGDMPSRLKSCNYSLMRASIPPRQHHKRTVMDKCGRLSMILLSRLSWIWRDGL